MDTRNDGVHDLIFFTPQHFLSFPHTYDELPQLPKQSLRPGRSPPMIAQF